MSDDPMRIVDEMFGGSSAAHPRAPDIAAATNILELFVRDVRRDGLVGEDKNAKLLYLALTSRVLDRPVSVSVKGPSSGGKSYTIDQVLSFFPASAYFERTAMSTRNLAYTRESFRHRYIVLFEAAGLGEDGGVGAYLVRSLLSEGRLLYEYVDPKKHDTVLIDKPGPTGLILSTTSAALHPENETRMLSVTVTDTREQTRRVLHRIARDANGGEEPAVDRRPWIDLQTWIEQAEHRVAIPYIETLADLIEPEAVRLRRDFQAVVGLIKAHAILHQLSRERDAQGRIVATLEDYRAVFEVVADVVSDGIGRTVPEATRETVAAVEELSAEHRDGVPLPALAAALELDKSSASRRAAKARHDGYLVNLEERRGRPARYQVGEPLPDRANALPAPSVLAAALPPATPAMLQHPAERKGSATVDATLGEDKAAGQGPNSADRCSVARVAGGRGKPLHAAPATGPQRSADPCPNCGARSADRGYWGHSMRCPRRGSR